MTLQYRLMMMLLLSAPLVWGAGLLYGLREARIEINELFDTQQIRLARQVLATLPTASLDVMPANAATFGPPGSVGSPGDADLDELSIAVWNRQDKLLLVDREGVLLPIRRESAGFVDITLGGEAWRVFYLPTASDEWRVAVGQKQEERDELVWGLLVGQLVPWVLTLPVLLLVMAGAVRQALRPIRALTDEIDRRTATDLRPLATQDLPTDLNPLLQSMNTLLARIAEGQQRERRFIADAAHELRTPLAALQAQWDAQRLQSAGALAASHPDLPTSPPDKISQGLARMGRLVAQLLSLSRLDQPLDPATLSEVDWRPLVERLFGDLLPMANQHKVDLECAWPPSGQAALPLRGHPDLLAAMLRNLLENAVRHSAAGQTVTLAFSSDAIEVTDDGSGVDEEHLARIGDRFYRPPWQEAPGSGLGLSIVKRIAGLHGLQAHWANRSGQVPGQRGFAVRLTRAG